MEHGSPILCPHSGPAKVRWVKEPPLRLEAYAMHCAGTHHGIAGELIGDLLEEVLPNVRRERPGGIEDGT
jgi:hypothetical protein